MIYHLNFFRPENVCPVTEAEGTTANSDSEEDIPLQNEPEADDTDRYSDNQNSTYQEIEEEIIEELVLDPFLLEQEMSNVEFQPEKLRLSDLTGIPSVDSPTVQLNNSNHDALRRYRPLYIAAERGDWESAKELFDKDPESLTALITAERDTALLIAVDRKHWRFAENLIKLMPGEALQLQETEYGNTALHIAAREGKKEIAEAIVNKNPNATQIRNKQDEVPLATATLSVSRGQKDIIEYLCNVTRDEESSPFSGPDGASLLCDVIKANFYGIGLFIFKRYPKVIIEKTKNLKMWPLEAIANRPFSFKSGSKLNFWQHNIYTYMSTPSCYRGMGDIENPSECPKVDREIFAKFFTSILNYLIPRVPSIKELYAQKLVHEEAATLVKDMIAQLEKLTTKTEALSFFENSYALKTAIKDGTTEIVEECLRVFPDLVWIETNNQTLIHIAIEERNETIVKLICETSDEDDKNELLSRGDTHGNGVLHFAAKLASSTQLNLVSGAALQMQREMQFFKGMEKMVGRTNRLVRNKDGNTAQFMFTKEHDKLRKDGEEWMKGTSSHCMVVAALIATVVFAAAFTVPGGSFSDGNDSKKGIPIFLHKTSFMVFAIADALALFSSVTSILMFLAILTSRYAEEDFLTSLPTKLIIGLGTLFFSIAATMVAFGATLSIVLGHKFAWILIPITLFGCVPVTLFALLQSPLLVEMVRSTYWPSTFRA
ncbi:hypothetical protein C5167_040886 [Papaver somniferum]|uniref:PGG domain-containing protein n=2 Tax=Papaver somniferum TaxID=3469 RepID=A0A4Y7IJQ6_PAPSO|nr:hypothetical protein C5167_040886 [Papaver somniferum]